MHETIIANKIIDEAKKHGDIDKIFLEIGELAHIPSHELVSVLRNLVGWKIFYKEKKAKVMCNCGFKGNPIILERGHDYFYIECPNCKEIPELIDGDKIIIKKVEVK